MAKYTKVQALGALALMILAFIFPASLSAGDVKLPVAQVYEITNDGGISYNKVGILKVPVKGPGSKRVTCVVYMDNYRGADGAASCDWIGYHRGH